MHCKLFEGEGRRGARQGEGRGGALDGLECMAEYCCSSLEVVVMFINTAA